MAGYVDDFRDDDDDLTGELFRSQPMELHKILIPGAKVSSLLSSLSLPIKIRVLIRD